MPDKSPDTNFQKLLQELQKHAKKMATVFEGDEKEQPQWQMPPMRDWDGNVLDITKMHKPFARDELNEQYKDALHDDTATTADCMGTKVQLDYMAMMERAFRLRHTTLIRSVMHAAGRIKAHGDDAGVHTGGVLQYVQDLLGVG